MVKRDVGPILYDHSRVGQAGFGVFQFGGVEARLFFSDGDRQLQERSVGMS